MAVCIAYGTAKAEIKLASPHTAMIIQNNTLFLFICRRIKYITSTAMTEKVMSRVCGDKISERITRAATEAPAIKMNGGNPSRYMTRKNEKYTSASPVSF